MISYYVRQVRVYRVGLPVLRSGWLAAEWRLTGLYDGGYVVE